MRTLVQATDTEKNLMGNILIRTYLTKETKPSKARSVQSTRMHSSRMYTARSSTVWEGLPEQRPPP